MSGMDDTYPQLVMLSLLFEGCVLAEEVANLQNGFELPLTQQQLLETFADELSQEDAARIESVITDVFIEYNTEVDYGEDVDDLEIPQFPDRIECSSTTYVNWFAMRHLQSEILQEIEGTEVEVHCKSGVSFNVKAEAAFSYLYHGHLAAFACDLCDSVPELEYVNDFGV